MSAAAALSPSPSPTPTPASSSAINLKNLAGSLALLFGTCALVAGALWWTHTQAQLARQSLLAAQARHSETRARLARVSDDEREIREKITRYREIINRGLTQPEQRLHWIETLRSIKEARRLLGLNYEISPQRVLDSRGGYDFLVSSMRLDMPLLHENDLLGLIDDLVARVPAIVSVKSCRIERSANEHTRSSAQLQASCEIDWIKLQEKP